MRSQNPFREGFTLIELLLVVAIIGVLTVLFVTAMASANPKAKIAVAQAELGQLESAIQDYKTTLGFYPPDNPNNAALNPLYFELLGTTNDGNRYVTLDARGQIANGPGDINAEFSRQGFANSSTRAHSSDEAGAPMSFLTHLKGNQIGQIVPNKPLIKILVCSVGWPSGTGSAPIPGTTLNPWQYVSSKPTNNIGSYDLWVDLSIGGKVHRVSNWSRQPQIVP